VSATLLAILGLANALYRSTLITGIELIDNAIALRTFVFFAYVSITLGYTLVFTIPHLSPRKFLEKPFILFLRRFSTFSDRSIQNAILKVSPAGKPIAFLTATQSRAGDWDPFRIGFAGMKILHSIKSTPIFLRSSNEDWKRSAEELINRAEVITLDLSQGSGAIKTEIEMIERLSRWDSTVILISKQGMVDLEAQQIIGYKNKGATIVNYKKSWGRALLRLLLGIPVVLLIGLWLNALVLQVLSSISILLKGGLDAVIIYYRTIGSALFSNIDQSAIISDLESSEIINYVDYDVIMPITVVVSVAISFLVYLVFFGRPAIDGQATKVLKRKLSFSFKENEKSDKPYRLADTVLLEENNKDNLPHQADYGQNMNFLHRRFLKAKTEGLRDHGRRNTLIVLGTIIMLLFITSLALLRSYYLADEEASQQKNSARQHLYLATVNLAEKNFENGQYGRMSELLNASLPVRKYDPSSDSRSFAWYHLWHRFHMERRTIDVGSEIGGILAFHPDGISLVHGRAGIKVWDIATGRELPATIELNKNYSGYSVFSPITISPDGKTMAISVGYMIKLWDISNAHELPVNNNNPSWSENENAALSSDAKTFAISSSEDDFIVLWDLSTGHKLQTTSIKKLEEKGFGWHYQLKFSPNGKILAIGDRDGKVWLWDLESKREPEILNAGEVVANCSDFSCLAFSNDGKTLASGGLDHSIKLWDLSTGRELPSLRGHTAAVSSIAFSPVGNTLASGSKDATIILWDITNHERSKTLTGHSDRVVSLAFSPDGQTLASGGGDAMLKLWDLGSAGELQNLMVVNKNAVNEYISLAKMSGSDVTFPSPYQVSFSPDGKSLASVASMRHEIWLFDLPTSGEQVFKFSYTIFSGDFISMISGMAFSPDGRMLASSSGNAIQLWDAVTGKYQLALSGNLNRTVEMTTSVVFSPDGKILASVGTDNIIKLWDLSTGLELASLSGTFAEVLVIEFSPDGNILASGHRDGSVRLWYGATEEEVTAQRGGSLTVDHLTDRHIE